jgi:CRP/FNR family transcriptional regulator, cyclic AMP receptor protein
VADDAFDGLTQVVPSAIAKGGVRGRAPAGRGRTDRPLSRDDLQMLADVPLFAGLSRRHLRRLADHADVTAFRDGETIVREGQAGGTFYVVVEGEAKVRRRDRTVGTLGPGEFFGEISLLDGGPRTADVVASTPVLAIRIFRQAFDRMLVEERGVAAKILAVVARRLRDSERSLRS